MQHIPVLFHEVLDTLNLFPGGLYVDGTIGAGGHAQGILKAISPEGKLLGLDRDPAALEIAESLVGKPLMAYCLIWGSPLCSWIIRKGDLRFEKPVHWICALILPSLSQLLIW